MNDKQWRIAHIIYLSRDFSPSVWCAIIDSFNIDLFFASSMSLAFLVSRPRLHAATSVNISLIVGRTAPLFTVSFANTLHFDGEFAWTSLAASFLVVTALVSK